ncbi:MAG: hypothetical protein B5M48_00110 [Candidatus Omnitrophica bacterium 4484_213]|nr:MAG: hypothetical protein B5M48_00110 [Candidatus Omnitrophica bacterium 4484_213]
MGNEGLFPQTFYPQFPFGELRLSFREEGKEVKNGKEKSHEEKSNKEKDHKEKGNKEKKVNPFQ